MGYYVGWAIVLQLGLSGAGFIWHPAQLRFETSVPACMPTVADARCYSTAW